MNIIQQINKCKIRKDLLKSNLSVPIGNSTFINTNKSLYFKYNYDKFLVFYNKKWQIAESLDFEFVTNNSPQT